MRRKALKQKKKLESSPFWNPESTELESRIQYSESGIHRVESRIQDCHQDCSTYSAIIKFSEAISLANCFALL